MPKRVAGYVVVMSCKYEGIQELYDTLYRDRDAAEAFAKKARAEYIASRIAGIEVSLAYHQERLGEGPNHARSLQRDREELALWRAGEFASDGAGYVDSYAWRVIELEADE